MTDPDSDSVRIGRQIRDLRKAKGITLQALAQQIGRSVGYVSQVERGVSTLPIPILQSISEMLGVQITWFFHSDGDQPLHELGHVVRADARRQLNYSGTGIREELLSPGLSGDLLMLLTTFSPLAQTDPAQRKRVGEEAAFIQSGRLNLIIDENEFQLSEGDSFTLKVQEKFQATNPSEQHDAVVIWVITPPSY